MRNALRPSQEQNTLVQNCLGWREREEREREISVVLCGTGGKGKQKRKTGDGGKRVVLSSVQCRAE